MCPFDLDCFGPFELRPHKGDENLSSFLLKVLKEEEEINKPREGYGRIGKERMEE